jgi:hypothetical protein
VQFTQNLNPARSPEPVNGERLPLSHNNGNTKAKQQNLERGLPLRLPAAGVLPQKSDEEEVAELEGPRLAAARTELEATKTELKDVQKEFKELEPRLSFAPKLPTSVLLSITVSSERELASALLA